MLTLAPGDPNPLPLHVGSSSSHDSLVGCSEGTLKLRVCSSSVRVQCIAALTAVRRPGAPSGNVSRRDPRQRLGWSRNPQVLSLDSRVSLNLRREPNRGCEIESGKRFLFLEGWVVGQSGWKAATRSLASPAPQSVPRISWSADSALRARASSAHRFAGLLLSSCVPGTFWRARSTLGQRGKEWAYLQEIWTKSCWRSASFFLITTNWTSCQTSRTLASPLLSSLRHLASQDDHLPRRPSPLSPSTPLRGPPPRVHT